MGQMDLRKELRRYLKGFRGCQSQAKDIETMLAGGNIPDIVKEPLVKAKADFELQCKNVQLIIGYTRDGLERRIFNAIYVFGKSMRQVAKETGYSYGHCSNTEMNAINRLCAMENVVALLSTR